MGSLQWKNNVCVYIFNFFFTGFQISNLISAHHTVIPLHNGNDPFHFPFSQFNFLDDSGIRISSSVQTNSTSLPWKNSFPITLEFVPFDGSEHFSANELQ
jgi:hypothetical protein